MVVEWAAVRAAAAAVGVASAPAAAALAAAAVQATECAVPSSPYRHRIPSTRAARTSFCRTSWRMTRATNASAAQAPATECEAATMEWAVAAARATALVVAWAAVARAARGNRKAGKCPLAPSRSETDGTKCSAAAACCTCTNSRLLAHLLSRTSYSSCDASRGHRRRAVVAEKARRVVAKSASQEADRLAARKGGVAER